MLPTFSFFLDTLSRDVLSLLLQLHLESISLFCPYLWSLTPSTHTHIYVTYLHHTINIYTHVPIHMDTHIHTYTYMLFCRLCHSFVSDSLQPPPMDCSPPGSSAHEILQTRILEWAAISSPRGSFQSRDRTHISCVSHIVGRFFPHWAIGKHTHTHTHTHTHIYAYTKLESGNKRNPQPRTTNKTARTEDITKGMKSRVVTCFSDKNKAKPGSTKACHSRQHRDYHFQISVTQCGHVSTAWLSLSLKESEVDVRKRG